MEYELKNNKADSYQRHLIQSRQNKKVAFLLFIGLTNKILYS